MKDDHAILKQLPHTRIESGDDRFDLFALGIFEAAGSDQSLKEIVELVELEENACYRPHFHARSSAVIYMVLGEGELILGENSMAYHAGLRFNIPAKMPHGFVTRTKTLFLSIQSPPIRDVKTNTIDLHYVE